MFILKHLEDGSVSFLESPQNELTLSGQKPVSHKKNKNALPPKRKHKIST